MHTTTFVRVALCLSLLAPWTTARGQGRFERAGLSGRVVYDLAQWGSTIYAATDDGLYVHALEQAEDTLWRSSGLQGMHVRAVYPHQSGALGYAVTAGIDQRMGDADSVVIYCSQNSDSAWMPADDGIDRSLVRLIRSIDGFPSPAICGETFAASEGLLFRREIGGIWQKIFDLGISVTNVVRVNTATVSVWVGGETTIFAPFISRSDDKGESWSTSYPDLQGDNACDAFAFDPSDTAIVYAGMEGSVIVSRDGGTSWESAGLSGTPFYFYGLEVNTSTRQLFAGGAAHGGLSGLYVTTLGSLIWTALVPTQAFAGILNILSVPSAEKPSQMLLGTDGDGVVRYVEGPSSTADEPVGQEFSLRQNYPNPFNPATTIEFTVPAPTSVTLKIYDMLGRELATLVSGRRQPGRYSVVWDATGVPSGVYLARLRGGHQSETMTVMLIR
jgi:hypothetical protein